MKLRAVEEVLRGGLNNHRVENKTDQKNLIKYCLVSNALYFNSTTAELELILR